VSASGVAPGVRIPALVCDAPGARQDRRACCGTMNLAEYYDVESVLDAEAQALARWCAEHGRFGPAAATQAASQAASQAAAQAAAAVAAGVGVAADGAAVVVAAAAMPTAARSPDDAVTIIPIA
jgi:hypothetical protein